ncbi:hypothetical protein AVEN_213844-1 [Araneus ventricosus]|uniref:Uncharacterized protein n=1 Tax=Araneus ventricosus TaxID=182803 RepID=A0A4Y2K1V4_ARAVE|nr:hypothetical protein AVEN_213844-1 [Araneus ventricosus]
MHFISDESNNEPAGESAASLSASEEPTVSGTTEELLSCEIPVNCSEGESVLFDLNLNVDDPRTWPENLTDTQRCFIVSKLMNKLVNEPDLSNTYRDGNYQMTGFTKFYQTVKKLIDCG